MNDLGIRNFLDGLCELPVAYRIILISACVLFGGFSVVRGSDLLFPSEGGLAQVLDAQDAELRLLKQEIDHLKMQLHTGALAEQHQHEGVKAQPTAALANFSQINAQRNAVVEVLPEETGFRTVYQGGFLIEPYNKRKTPFELKINSWIQFRHHAFTRHGVVDVLQFLSTGFFHHI